MLPIEAKPYRINHFGADVPQFLSEEDVRRVLMFNYRGGGVVEALMEAMKRGQRVHVRTGVIAGSTSKVRSLGQASARV